MMKHTRTHNLIGATLAAMAVTCASNAAEIMVTADIAVSTTWTANNTYNLQNQIYVLPGATLTIQAGTILASTTNIGGSLAVCRGAQIFVQGTAANPVIMTSKADVATWTGGDPHTGTWRPGHNEWGNLTIMGEAFISENAVAGNSQTCNTNNYGVMEGLIASGAGDTKVRYGGNQDNDDSGTITYLSLRYGGKVVGLNNELNGLSLGGVGRATDIDHIEIMNNVDDGIEIWGGTVNLKYVNIWNVGDDSFDVDQGWRGKTQFGLIVQGYSDNAAQGSGVGDNSFETDGAEDSDAQPVTTAVVYNYTVVGQPSAGDQATAWRDNARVQYRNCIFMDTGEQVVKNDNIDGDGGHGYGFNGTLTWPQTWTTNYTYAADETTGAPNICNNAAARYTAQTSGKLAEITDTVFYRNLFASAYTESDARGVTIAGGSNPAKDNVVAANMPIVSLTRAAPITLTGSQVLVRVTKIDPRPANDALTSGGAAPNDGFFTQANYRGGFASNSNWLCGWTATDAYGFLAVGACVAPCPSDIDGSGTVGVADLLTVIGAWGPCATCPGTPCPADINGDCTIGVSDLLTVISAWGPCP